MRTLAPRSNLARALCLLGWLVALTPPPAGAADVTGTVRNAETGETVDFVTVQILRTAEDGGVVRGVMSTSEGFYFIPDVPAGRYVARFSRVGFETVEENLVVTEDKTYSLDVALVVRPVAVEEIIVEADRYQSVKDIQTGFLNLEAGALAELPGVIEADPIRTLTLLPGVQAASDFSSGLYVRGGGADQTLVLLDKVTVYNPTHAFGFFSSFNADALDEVNLYKGAYPAEHGGRLGAVLDVRSREGDASQAAGRGGVSTIASRLQLEGPVFGGAWMAAARRTHLDPFLDAIRSEDNEIPDYYFYDINARVSMPARGGKVNLSGYKGRDDLRFDLERDTYIDLDWGNALVTAAYRRAFGESVVGEARVAGTEYESKTDLLIFGTPIGISNRIREYSGAVDVTWSGSDAWTLTAGTALSHYDLEYFQEFNGERQVDYARQPWEAAGFGQAQWTPRRGTILLAGARVRYLDDGERVRVEPRWSASRRLAPRWRLKLGGGIYYQYLQLVSTEGFSAADFYVPIDATADPGRSFQTVLGVEWTPGAAYEVSVEGYYTDLSDLVQFNTDVSGDSEDTDAADLFYTGGEGYASGVELFVHRRRGNLTGWIGYTLGWTRRTFSDLNQGESFPPKYDRRHDLSLVAQYRRGKWTLGGNFVLASGQAFTPAAAVYGLRNPATGQFGDPQLLPAARNSARLLPYHRLDVSVARDVTWFGQSFEWYLQVFNVYSRRNEWFVQYDLDDAVAEPEVVKMLPIVPSLGINVEF
jgi:hypothetical protein